MNPADVEEAIQFFKEEEGFHRLLKGMVEKYIRLGRIGGTVVLRHLTEREKEVLSAFFRKDFTRQTSATISLSHFEQALQQTRFANVPVKVILEGCFGRHIIPKREADAQFKREKELFFRQLLFHYAHPRCQLWLKHIISNQAGSRGIHAAYGKDPALLKSGLEDVLKAIGQLPEDGQYIRLSVFANRITGDPHAFDEQGERGKLLIHALQVIRCHHDRSYRYISAPTAEERAELFQYFGLVKDDILNFVTCTGLIAYGAEGNGPLPLWRAAYEQNSVLNVPLRELRKVDAILPGDGRDNPNEERFVDQNSRAGPHVYVVENSGVFSALMDAFEQKREVLGKHLRMPPLVCTHGHFKLAAWMLIDKLVLSNCTIYYSGDFDPEGLIMAQKLKMRYPEHVHFWRYSAADYTKCKSLIELEDHSRLKKLDAISDPVLTEMARKIRETKKIAYQEELIPHLIGDLQQTLD